MNWSAHWTSPASATATPAPGLVKLNDGSCLYIHAVSPAAQKTASPMQYRTRRASPLGDDPSLNQQFEAANKAFKARIPVLLLGENGTSKEVFARALHDQVNADAPFVAINCSAIPESLIEAELFGYADGTFTGARRGGAKGRIEEANGGTLLLDEIGDMPAAQQTRLLRVLQERQITRLGSSDTLPLDIQIISATHCDLEQKINERSFREDLYYRLNGIQVRLPALCERQDLRTLIETLLRRFGGGRLHADSLSCLRHNAGPATFANWSRHCASGQHWPAPGR